jgi:hypothetical protein
MMASAFAALGPHDFEYLLGQLVGQRAVGNAPDQAGQLVGFDRRFGEVFSSRLRLAESFALHPVRDQLGIRPPACASVSVKNVAARARW